VKVLQISQPDDRGTWTIELKTDVKTYRLNVDSESLVSASQLALSVIEQFIDKSLPLELVSPQAQRAELANHPDVTFGAVADEVRSTEVQRVRQACCRLNRCASWKTGSTGCSNPRLVTYP
jgi:hypothetical protein